MPILLVTTSAVAQPASDAFETCKVRRRELTAEAMKIADPVERGRQLAAMPVCARNPDGSVEVVDPKALPPPATEEVDSHGSLALVAGASATAIGYQVRMSSAIAPYLEVDGGWHRHAYWVGAFAGYASFDDRSYLGMYDVSHRFYELGLRAGYHFPSLDLGAGLGIELDHGHAFADVPERWDELPLVDVNATYDLARTSRFDIVLRAVLAFGLTTRTSTDLSLYGDIISARLALGVRFR